MSTLSSSSTLAEIKAAYADNASYREDNSPAKAAAFITACRLLILQIPVDARQGQSGVQMDLEGIRAELNKAEAWLTANPVSATTNPRVIRLGVEDFRG